jgi:hypothetical protein
MDNDPESYRMFGHDLATMMCQSHARGNTQKQLLQLSTALSDFLGSNGSKTKRFMQGSWWTINFVEQKGHFFIIVLSQWATWPQNSCQLRGQNKISGVSQVRTLAKNQSPTCGMLKPSIQARTMACAWWCERFVEDRVQMRVHKGGFHAYVRSYSRRRMPECSRLTGTKKAVVVRTIYSYYRLFSLSGAHVGPTGRYQLLGSN